MARPIAGPLLVSCALLALGCAPSSCRRSTARADDYPSRPVKIIVAIRRRRPDRCLRPRDCRSSSTNRCIRPFVVENRPGAGTTLGTELVAKATPDGYTLLMASSTQTVNETLYQNKAYAADARSRSQSRRWIDNDLVLVVSPGVPAHNVAELIALARSQARHAQFRVVGAGLELPHGCRAFEKPHRHRHRACAV